MILYYGRQMRTHVLISIPTGECAYAAVNMGRRPMRLAWLVVLATACGSGAGSAPRCVPGASAACGCDDGTTGAQTCGAEGTWAPCRRAGVVCTTVTAGADGGATQDGGSGGTATNLAGLTVKDADGGVIGTLLDVTYNDTWRVYHHGEGVVFQVNPRLGFVATEPFFVEGSNQSGVDVSFAGPDCTGAAFAHSSVSSCSGDGGLGSGPGLRYLVVADDDRQAFRRGTRAFVTDGVYRRTQVRSFLESLHNGESHCYPQDTPMCGQGAIERPDFPLAFPAPLTLAPSP